MTPDEIEAKAREIASGLDADWKWDGQSPGIEEYEAGVALIATALREEIAKALNTTQIPGSKARHHAEGQAVTPERADLVRRLLDEAGFVEGPGTRRLADYAIPLLREAADALREQDAAHRKELRLASSSGNDWRERLADAWAREARLVALLREARPLCWRATWPPPPQNVAARIDAELGEQG